MIALAWVSGRQLFVFIWVGSFFIDVAERILAEGCCQMLDGNKASDGLVSIREGRVKKINPFEMVLRVI